jgi:F0F1-type ATP synthase membrane subunit b/b'
LADHHAKFEADNQQAAQRLAEAENTKQEMDAARENLQAELNEHRSSEMEAIQRQSEQTLAEARTAAQRELEQSHLQASRMSETQRDRLAEVSATAAAQAVGRLLEQIGGPDLQSALVDSACQQLASLPHDTLGSVKVESTRPLSPEQLSALSTALGPAADGADFRTVDGLGDGVRISTSKGLIDASVKGLVQFASQSLVKEMGRLTSNHNPLQNVNDA